MNEIWLGIVITEPVVLSLIAMVATAVLSFAIGLAVGRTWGDKELELLVANLTEDNEELLKSLIDAVAIIESHIGTTDGAAS